MRRFIYSVFPCFILLLLFCACIPEKRSVEVTPLNLGSVAVQITKEFLETNPPTSTPTITPSETPTPVPTEAPLYAHPVFRLDAIPTLRAETLIHEIVSGDTLTNLSNSYQVSQDAIITANDISDPNFLQLGGELIIPAQIPDIQDNGFTILPDQAILYGPDDSNFSVEAFIQGYPDSYLNHYSEPTPTPVPIRTDGEGETPKQEPFIPRNAAEIIMETAIENSIDPRILLTLLEFQTGLLTNAEPRDFHDGYEIVNLGSSYGTLDRQLAWAADKINAGFYRWQNNQINLYILDDNTVVQVDSSINPGTAALQYLFSKIFDRENWQYAVSINGFAYLYNKLFGNPEDFLSPVKLPKDQLNLTFPFSAGEKWYYTSGPHYGWSDGTPWAALDFAPGDAVGCSQSSSWVTAMADGEILYSRDGLVLQDIDGDHDLRTGWTLVYLHIAKNDRIAVGESVKQGDRIGRPSCEGGIANGTHVHIARRYNGQWIPIDADFPLVLSGWEAISAGTVYDGYLIHDEKMVEAWYFKTEAGEITY